MTSLNKKQQAAVASREASRAYLSGRKGGVLNLKLPTFDSLNVGGLIPYQEPRQPLRVSYDLSEMAEDGDIDPATVYITTNIRGKGATQWGTAIHVVNFANPASPNYADITAPFFRDIPASLLTQGEHEVGYIVWESPTSPSPLMRGAPLEIDETPPYGRIYPPAPIYPSYLVDEITETDIADNEDGMVCTFPAYTASRKPGDSITVYFSEDFSSQLSTPALTVPVTDALTFTVAWDTVRANAAGRNYLFYVLSDLAGNRSLDSTPARINLNLTDAPAPRQAEIPLALIPGDGLIDLQDVYVANDVIASIAEYANNLPETDVIQLTWGEEDPRRYNVADYMPFPLLLPVSRATILADYGTATGEKETTIEYLVDRRGQEFDAPSLDIHVDLSAPGPSPGPDPENPTLNRPTVFGGDRTMPNVLRPADFGNDATVEILLWDLPLPVPGITITGYWGDLEHPFDPTTLTTEAAGSTVTLTVPWATIREVGNNATLKVFYALSWRTNNNIQRSAPRDVNVRANVITLAPAQIRRDTAALACTDLNRVTWAAVVRVPGNTTYFTENMIIRGEWRVFSDAAGTTQLGPTYPFNSLPLTPDMVANGFDLTIQPYMTVLKPAARNSADFHYFVDVPGEGEVKSQRAYTRTRFADLNGVFCEDQVITSVDED
ncbi:hypothetical protein [Pseudomonas yamanorum]